MRLYFLKKTRILFAVFLFMVTSFFLTQNVASNDEKSLPLRVDADSLKHDDKNLITTFQGNVVLVRNNLTIKGEVLQLKQTADGLSYGYIIGSPANFKQKREIDGEWIEGKARRLDYDERNSMFFLTGNATLQRKKNGEIKDEVAGDKLSYNNITEVYKAETTPGKTRTRMTLMPRKSENDQTN